MGNEGSQPIVSIISPSPYSYYYNSFITITTTIILKMKRKFLKNKSKRILST